MVLEQPPPPLFHVFPAPQTNLPCFKESHTSAKNLPEPYLRPHTLPRKLTAEEGGYTAKDLTRTPHMGPCISSSSQASSSQFSCLNLPKNLLK